MDRQTGWCGAMIGCYTAALAAKSPLMLPQIHVGAGKIIGEIKCFGAIGC